ncbi:hemagglutinin repeat-containing protein, partial [Frateuria defendens]|uniref:hemagglutinin repeat-containing protein n=1 Tax=Frateuria defendens TaxID=2219559 RepID=UPI0019298F97
VAQAAQLAGTHDVTLSAGHDISLGTGADTHVEAHSSSVKKSGVFGGGGASGLGGIGFTVGSASGKASSTVEQHTTTGSLVGSTEGNVTVVAGGDVAITGSDLIAGRAAGATSGGNIAVQGQNITIAPAAQTDHETNQQKQSQHGVTVAMVNTPLDGFRNIQQNSHSGNGNQVKRWDSVAQAVGNTGLDAPGVAIGYGSHSASHAGTYDSVTQQGSSLRAAGDLSLTATGAHNSGGDLSVIGSALSAGGTATLDAQRDLNLLASTDSLASGDTNHSHHRSIVAAPVGLGDMFRQIQGGSNSSGVSMSPYNLLGSNGQSAQTATTQTATTIDADRIDLVSRQGDITAQGAQLNAQHDITALAQQGGITLGNGENSQAWQSRQSSHQFGDLGGSGYSGTTGERSEQHQTTGSQTQQSTVRTGIASAQG